VTVPRASLAAALGASLALHLLLAVLIPAMRVRLPPSTEHLVEVELARPPLPAEPETVKPPEPAPLSPLSPEEAEALGSSLAAFAPAGGPPPPATSPVRLPQRVVRLPEPDTIPWARLAPVEMQSLPSPPRLPAERAAAPDTGAAAELARTLLRSAQAPAAPGQEAAGPAAMQRLEIEGPVGLDRKVVHEPPPPRVPIRNPASVAIRFFVSPRGDVTRALPTQRGDPELDRAALAYIKAFRFSPLPAGEEKEQWGTIHVRFRLE